MRMDSTLGNPSGTTVMSAWQRNHDEGRKTCDARYNAGSPPGPDRRCCRAPRRGPHARQLAAPASPRISNRFATLALAISSTSYRIPQVSGQPLTDILSAS